MKFWKIGGIFVIALIGLVGLFLIRERLIQRRRPLITQPTNIAANHPIALVVNQRSNDISVVDLQKRQVIGRIPVGNNPHEIAYSSTTKLLATSNFQHDSVTIIDAGSLIPDRNLKVGSKPHGLVFSADGRKLYVTIEGEKAVAVISGLVSRPSVKSSTPPEVVKKISVPEGTHLLERTPDGKIIVSANTSGSMTLVDAAIDEVIVTVETGPGAEGLAIDPTGQFVYVANRGDDTLSVVDIRRDVVQKDSSVIREVKTGKGPIRVLAHPARPLLFVTHLGSNDLWVYDRASFEVIKKEKMPLEPIGMALSQDGNTLYIATIGSNDLYLWDVTQNRVITKISSIGAGPDGIVVLSR